METKGAAQTFQEYLDEHLKPSAGPVYLEGRLVLSLSFREQHPDLDPIKDQDRVIENYRLWDDASDTWYTEGLAVLRFEHTDVVMRLDPVPTALWSGALNIHARVVLVPDFDDASFKANQAFDLRWKRV